MPVKSPDLHGNVPDDAPVAVLLIDVMRGRPLVERLVPDDEDYFVLKPKHSGFYSTTLELLLAHLGARTLVLTV